MAIYYLDSSAIVKRYVDEPGSSWVRQICETLDTESGERVNYITIGEIAVTEVASAFAILVRRDLISKRSGEHAYEKFIGEFKDAYGVIKVTSDLLLSAAELTQRHPLKALDAIQLALSLHANKSLQTNALSLTFVTSDETLLRAALAEGLATENPHDQVDSD